MLRAIAYRNSVSTHRDRCSDCLCALSKVPYANKAASTRQISTIAIVTPVSFGLISIKLRSELPLMFDRNTPDWYDRSLEKALTNNLVDRYFSEAESWLRAILRMCIFSLTYTDRQTALLIECPNQAVAKRLSRKVMPLQDFVQRLSRRSRASKRVLICYLEVDGTWQCFDTKTNAWKCLKMSQVPTLGNW